MVFDPQKIVNGKLQLWARLAITANPQEYQQLKDLLPRFVKSAAIRREILEIIEERRGVSR